MWEELLNKWLEMYEDVSQINFLILWGGLILCFLLAFEIPKWIVRYLHNRKCKMIVKAIRREFLE